VPRNGGGGRGEPEIKKGGAVGSNRPFRKVASAKKRSKWLWVGGRCAIITKAGKGNDVWRGWREKELKLRGGGI